ncbi:MAG: TetR/AcrR family transcriptional regulator [Candidatus Binatia bacterium]
MQDHVNRLPPVPEMIFSISPMNLARRSIERSLAPRRARYQREVDALMRAAVRVMGRKGYAAATVADVLAEAHLSTRPFYRHFQSKDELFLAVFEQDSIAASERMRARLAAAAGPLEKLGAWVDEMLSLGYEPRRARRTKVLMHEAGALRAVFAKEFAAIYAAPEQALVPILEQGWSEGVFPAADPKADACSIRALTWEIVEASFDRGATLDEKTARARVLDFTLRALGADRETARRRLGF